MLVIFKCPDGHSFKRLMESHLDSVKCQECELVAVRDYGGAKTQVDVLDVVDNGFMTKKVEYSAKRVELQREQGDQYSRMVKKRLGIEEE